MTAELITLEQQRKRELELLGEVDCAALDVLTVVKVLNPKLPRQLVEALNKLADARQAVSLYRNQMIAQHQNNGLQPK
jgi:hypothetical protein